MGSSGGGGGGQGPVYDVIEANRWVPKTSYAGGGTSGGYTKKVKYTFDTSGRADEWNLFLSRPEGQKFLEDIDPQIKGSSGVFRDSAAYIPEGITYEAVGVKKINAEEAAVGAAENQRRLKGAKGKQETAAAVASRTGGVRNILSSGASSSPSSTILGGSGAAKTLLGI